MADVAGVADLKVELQVARAADRGRGRPAEAAARTASRRATSAARPTTLVDGRGGRRGLPRPARSTTSSSGARRRSATSLDRHPEPADRHADRRRRCGSATWPTSRSCRRRTRSSARTPRGGSTSTCNVAGRDLGRGRPRGRGRRCRGSTFPREYHPEFLGEYAARAGRRSSRLLVAGRSSPPSAIFLLLHVDFRQLAAGGAGLPDAAVRAGRRRARRRCSAAASCRSARWSGFVTVLGHRGPQRHHAGQPLPPPGDARRASRSARSWCCAGREERLAPILMTALATGLALVPLVVAGNMPGHEIEHPMAVVILGGLVTSTLLNLFVCRRCTCGSAAAGWSSRPRPRRPPWAWGRAAHAHRRSAIRRRNRR